MTHPIASPDDTTSARARSRPNTLLCRVADGAAPAFARRYSGFFVAAQAGAYTFTLTSDDGSYLWLNGASTPLINNNVGNGLGCGARLPVILTALCREGTREHSLCCACRSTAVLRREACAWTQCAVTRGCQNHSILRTPQRVGRLSDRRPEADCLVLWIVKHPVHAFIYQHAHCV